MFDLAVVIVENERAPWFQLLSYKSFVLFISCETRPSFRYKAIEISGAANSAFVSDWLIKHAFRCPLFFKSSFASIGRRLKLRTSHSCEAGICWRCTCENELDENGFWSGLLNHLVVKEICIKPLILNKVVCVRWFNYIVLTQIVPIFVFSQF